MTIRLIIGNWKMNGDLALVREMAVSLAMWGEKGDGSEIVLCPPAILLGALAQALEGADTGWRRRISLGGQNCHEADQGAYTGEISASMLAASGCRYVIIGHSERRAGHGENDERVAAKARTALAHDLVPICCVGEGRPPSGKAEDAGKALPERIACQALASLPSPPWPPGYIPVLAYEPLWAIGSGKAAGIAETASVITAVRAKLNAEWPGQGDSVRLIYGGSVSMDNASSILTGAGTDGLLIGGASLRADIFPALAASCQIC